MFSEKQATKTNIKSVLVTVEVNPVLLAEVGRRGRESSGGPRPGAAALTSRPGAGRAGVIRVV